MFTLCECEVRGIKWQLARQPNITPLSYNTLIMKYNDKTCATQVPNIAEDMLTGVPNQKILHLFWLGYGNLCTIPDVVIKALVKLSAGVPEKLPTAFKRMDPYLLAKHFPYLLNGNTSSLLHNCEEVGDCNRECRPLTKPTFLQETEAGRRLLTRLDSRMGDIARLAQQHAYEVWYDLNKYYYCSPYVTP